MLPLEDFKAATKQLLALPRLDFASWLSSLSICSLPPHCPHCQPGSKPFQAHLRHFQLFTGPGCCAWRQAKIWDFRAPEFSQATCGSHDQLSTIPHSIEIDPPHMASPHCPHSKRRGTACGLLKSRREGSTSPRHTLEFELHLSFSHLPTIGNKPSLLRATRLP